MVEPQARDLEVRGLNSDACSNFSLEFNLNSLYKQENNFYVDQVQVPVQAEILLK